MKKPGALSLIEISAYCNTCPIEEIVAQISKALPHAKEVLPQTRLPGGREGDPQTSSETVLKRFL